MNPVSFITTQSDNQTLQPSEQGETARKESEQNSPTITVKESKKEQSRSQKASLNSIAAMLDYAARLLVSFFLKPLLVVGLGPTLFGAWEVLSKMTGYLGPAAGQAGHALRWTTAHQQSSIDFDQKRMNVGSAFSVWLLLLPVFLLLSVSLAWSIPDWIDAPIESYPAIQLSAFLLAINVALTSLVEIPRSVLEGENLAYKRLGLSALLVCLGGGLMAAALWLETGVVGLAISMLVNTGLTGLFFLQVVRRHVEWFGIKRPEWKSIKGFFQLSSWFLSWNMVTRVMRSSDILILGLFGSLQMVTIYSLTKYAPETAINLVAILVFGVTPGLGGIIGKGDLQKAARVREELLSLTWLIATVAGCTTLFWNQSFLHLWVGTEFNAGSLETLLMVVMVTQFVLSRTDGSVIDLTLKMKGKVLVGVLSLIVSIVCAAVLVGYCQLGITGVCLGIITGRCLLTLAYPWFVGRFLGLNPLKQFLHAVRPALCTAGLFYVAMEFGSRLTVSGWFSLVGGVAITLVLLPLPLFLIGLPGEVRTRIKARIQSVVSSFLNRRKPV